MNATCKKGNVEKRLDASITSGQDINASPAVLVMLCLLRCASAYNDSIQHSSLTSLTSLVNSVSCSFSVFDNLNASNFDISQLLHECMTYLHHHISHLLVCLWCSIFIIYMYYKQAKLVLHAYFNFCSKMRKSYFDIKLTFIHNVIHLHTQHISQNKNITHDENLLCLCCSVSNIE
jgi:hypothetical protein